MPQLDISECLRDPMFADKVRITRRPYTVDNNGIVIVAPFDVWRIAVITQGSPHPMEQRPDAQNAKPIITIQAYRFQFYDPVTGKKNSFQPDIIHDNGNQYIVTKVYNWSRYGAGFTMAECSLYDFTEAGQ